MDAVEIKAGIWAYLTDNVSANAGFVVTEKGVVVIDTLDTPARGAELAATIQARVGEPVLFVINTHHHADHVFGNQAFDALCIAHSALPEQLSQTVARDLSPLAIAAWISDHPGDRWLAEELQVRYPDLTFDRELTIDIPPRQMILKQMGGHTPESIVVDLPDEGVLFAGDLVFEGRVPYLLQAHIGDTIQALRHLERLGARTIVPGHGALCDMAYVIRVRDYLQALQDKVGELMARGWARGDILDSDALPAWWTDDRPDLLRANVARVYDELAGRVGPG